MPLYLTNVTLYQLQLYILYLLYLTRCEFTSHLIIMALILAKSVSKLQIYVSQLRVHMQFLANPTLYLTIKTLCFRKTSLCLIIISHSYEYKLMIMTLFLANMTLEMYLLYKLQ